MKKLTDENLEEIFLLCEAAIEIYNGSIQRLKEWYKEYHQLNRILDDRV